MALGLEKENARARKKFVLSRIHCAIDLIERLRNNQELQECMCYVPKDVYYQLTKRHLLNLYSKPIKGSLIIHGNNNVSTNGHDGGDGHIKVEKKDVYSVDNANCSNEDPDFEPLDFIQTHVACGTDDQIPIDCDKSCTSQADFEEGCPDKANESVSSGFTDFCKLYMENSKICIELCKSTASSSKCSNVSKYTTSTFVNSQNQIKTSDGKMDNHADVSVISCFQKVNMRTLNSNCGKTNDANTNILPVLPKMQLTAEKVNTDVLEDSCDDIYNKTSVLSLNSKLDNQPKIHDEHLISLSNCDDIDKSSIIKNVVSIVPQKGEHISSSSETFDDNSEQKCTIDVSENCVSLLNETSLQFDEDVRSFEVKFQDKEGLSEGRSEEKIIGSDVDHYTVQKGLTSGNGTTSFTNVEGTETCKKLSMESFGNSLMQDANEKAIPKESSIFINDLKNIIDNSERMEKLATSSEKLNNDQENGVKPVLDIFHTIDKTIDSLMVHQYPTEAYDFKDLPCEDNSYLIKSPCGGAAGASQLLSDQLLKEMYHGVNNSSSECEKSSNSELLGHIQCTAGSVLCVSGWEWNDDHSVWVQLRKLMHASHSGWEEYPVETWIQLPNEVTVVSDLANITTNFTHTSTHSTKNLTTDVMHVRTLYSWEEAVSIQYDLHFNHAKFVLYPPDEESVYHLQSLPTGWTTAHDEALCSFLLQHAHVDFEGNGAKNILNITASTSCDDGMVENLLDCDPESFWESDGDRGNHWIKLYIKRNVVIRELLMTINKNDHDYLPTTVCIFGGSTENDMKELNCIHINPLRDLEDGMNDLTLLEPQSTFFAIIDVRIKACHECGIDTRIHGFKLRCIEDLKRTVRRDIFSQESLQRFPILCNRDPLDLLHRSILLRRCSYIIDAVLPFIVLIDSSDSSLFNDIKQVKYLLLLSCERIRLIERLLRESAEVAESVPVVYIDRRRAADYRSQPLEGLAFQNSIFTQVYDRLNSIQKNPDDTSLTYRFSRDYDQWWECKFILEGIIDQGGGFRDSLADMAEELCPSAESGPVPLPFFVRAPNQFYADVEAQKDVYAPNPSCQHKEMYEWIGNLMGACLRTKESLVLSLPSYFWKRLCSETVLWDPDFKSVDEVEVRQIQRMWSMTEQEFVEQIGNERMWCTTLSNGNVVELVRHGRDKIVSYEDRLAYCDAVVAARMHESDKQIAAIQLGLEKVVPRAVLELLTWSELEKQVCGDPEISIEALRRYTYLEEDVLEGDNRFNFLWLALENFTNEERSRYLRFVTGRRRLPTPINLSSDFCSIDDSLPCSSTCCNTLYLSNFSRYLGYSFILYTFYIPYTLIEVLSISLRCCDLPLPLSCVADTCVIVHVSHPSYEVFSRCACCHV